MRVPLATHGPTVELTNVLSQNIEVEVGISLRFAREQDTASISPILSFPLHSDRYFSMRAIIATLYFFSVSVKADREFSQDNQTRNIELFERWKSDYNKVYNSTAVENYRRGIFFDHVRYHDKVAAQENLARVYTDWCGRPTLFSGWADLTPTEMDQHTGGKRVGSRDLNATPVVGISERETRLFVQWKLEQKKCYNSTAEEARRRHNFVRHVRYHDAVAIAANLAKPESDECGRPQCFSGWADLTRDETISLSSGSRMGLGDFVRLTGPRVSNDFSEWHWRLRAQGTGILLALFAGNAPPAVDWRHHAPTVVTSAKDQV